MVFGLFESDKQLRERLTRERMGAKVTRKRLLIMKQRDAAKSEIRQLKRERRSLSPVVRSGKSIASGLRTLDQVTQKYGKKYGKNIDNMF